MLNLFKTLNEGEIRIAHTHTHTNGWGLRLGCVFSLSSSYLPQTSKCMNILLLYVNITINIYILIMSQ